MAKIATGVVGVNFRAQFVPAGDEDSPARFDYYLQAHTASRVFDAIPDPLPIDDTTREVVRAFNRHVSGNDSLAGVPAVSYSVEDLMRRALASGPLGVGMPDLPLPLMQQVMLEVAQGTRTSSGAPPAAAAVAAVSTSWFQTALTAQLQAISAAADEKSLMQTLTVCARGPLHQHRAMYKYPLLA